MNRLDLTLPQLPANLALDEALLMAAEAGSGRELLRFWEWPTPAVVLGAGGRIADDVDVDACDREGVPLLRRSSGGGTVLLGRGCLCYSLVLRYDRNAALRHVTKSYSFILGITAAALEATLAGSGDLVWNGRKVGGSAQQRKRDHLLHHGTILYDFNLQLIPRYLREPAKRPDYRGDRSHTDFVTCLPLPAVEIVDRLAQAWGADMVVDNAASPDLDIAIAERFGSTEWIRRL